MHQFVDTDAIVEDVRGVVVKPKVVVISLVVVSDRAVVDASVF